MQYTGVAPGNKPASIPEIPVSRFGAVLVLLLMVAIVPGCAPTGGSLVRGPEPPPDSALGAGASWPDTLGEPDPGAHLRGMLVMSFNLAGAIGWMNPDTQRMFAFARVGPNPRELTVSIDQSRIYAVNFGGGQFGAGSISILSATSRVELDRLDFYPYGAFHGLAAVRSGVYLYAATETRRSILEINLLSRQVDRTFVLPHGVPNEVALDPSETRLYVTDLSGPTLFAVNLASGDVQEARVGNGPEEVVVQPDGSSVWVANRDDGTISVLDPYTLGTIEVLGSGRAPVRIAFTPDGSRAYVVNAGEAALAVFDARTRVRLGSIAVGAYPLGIALDADGTRAYVASTRDDEVSVVDLATSTVTARVHVGPEPFGLVWVNGNP